MAPVIQKKPCHSCSARTHLPDGWYCEDCDPDINDFTPAWALTHSLKNKTLRRERGLSVEEYAQMLDGAQCEICGTTENGDKVLCVDHCHRSGDVRGMLCTHCNFMIGFARDNPDILNKAIRYLNASR